MENNEFIDKIVEYNKGRDSERLKIKMHTMQSDPFAFMRGCCHLYYDDLVQIGLPHSPSTWLCGDLHLQNFGSFRGDNQQVYYDMNDFDESILGECLYDFVRLLTSVIVGSRTINVPDEGIIHLSNLLITNYKNALIDGKARWVERETAKGMIKDLLISLKGRTTKDFVNERTETKGKNRVIKIDGKKALSLDNETKEKVKIFFDTYAFTGKLKNSPIAIDVARRIAGNGSLGVQRYVILAKSQTLKDEYYLFDLKKSIPSALTPHIKIPQPQWKSQSERVVLVQHYMQAISPAFLNHVTFENDSYLIKELQPTDDKINLSKWNGKIKRLEQVIKTNANVVAWSQLRSGGHKGSAIADELIDFGTQTLWTEPLLNVATEMANKIIEQWKVFKEVRF